MKTVSRVFELKTGDCTIEIPTTLTDNLALFERSVLYGVFLPSKNSYDQATCGLNPHGLLNEPQSTLVASPFPVQSWVRLVRASFSVGTGNGKVLRLFKLLERLALFPRHVEAVEGIDLQNIRFSASDFEKQPGGERLDSNDIRPSAMVVFEVPREDALSAWLDQPESEFSIDRAPLKALHQKLRDLLDSPDENEDEAGQKNGKRNKIVTRATVALKECVKLAQEGAKGESGEKRSTDDPKPFQIKLDWLSPMKTLNLLGKRIKQETSQLPAFKAKLELKRAANGRDLAVDCGKWMPFLWPSVRENSYRTKNPVEHGKGVVIDADSDEKVLTARFFPLDDFAVSEFEIELPAALLDHRWMRWVFDILNRCGGSIIAANSSARLIGRWTNLLVTAVFPLRRDMSCQIASVGKARNCPVTDYSKTCIKDEKDKKDEHRRFPCEYDVSKIVECFRKLKETPLLGSPDQAPSRINVFMETTLARQLHDLTCQLTRDVGRNSAAARSYRNRVFETGLDKSKASQALQHQPKLEAVLQRVSLLYARPTSLSTPDYEQRFGRNPFDFTNPLDLSRFKNLYDPQLLEKSDSRYRLAWRICQRLSVGRGENIVIVGAHRSGKTSLMNIVVDRLNRGEFSEPTGQKHHVIAVRIQAALTPPQELLSTIIHQILARVLTREQKQKLEQQQPDSPESKESRKIAKRFMRGVKTFVKRFDPRTLGISAEFSLPLVAKIAVSLAEADDKNKGYRPKTRFEQLVEEFKCLETIAEMEPLERRAKYLKASAQLLKEILKDINSPAKGGKTPPPIRLVVAMDEIGDAGPWGGAWAYPTWRFIIESEEFTAIKWLFSTTHGLVDDSHYSPLSNALREYNLEPLRKEEARSLLRIFEYPPRNNRNIFWPGIDPIDPQTPPSEQHVDDEFLMRPTLTFRARRFICYVTGQQPYLIQVACCHLFEQAVREHVPVITEALAETVIMDRVIADLFDYFDAQWKSMSDELKKAIEASLPNEIPPLAVCAREERRFAADIDPSLRKALLRSGLASEPESVSVVPLFCIWHRRPHHAGALTGQAG